MLNVNFDQGKGEIRCINGVNLEPMGFKLESGGIVIEKQPGSAVFLIKGFKHA